MRTTATSEDMKNATRRLVRYVDRLERARSHIDRRIGILSGGVVSSLTMTLLTPQSPRSGGFPSDAPTLSRFKGSLYTILSDPSSLAYWLEFMERRDRSHLVQFWLTVEGFKDPLEASGQNLALENVTEEGEAPPAVNDATIVDDTAFLYQTYFDKSEHTIAIPPKLVAEIAEVASHTSALGLADARRAKRAVYESQRLVYEQMELEDWPAFQKSPLYIKAIADLKNTRPRPSLRSVSYSPPAAPGSPLPPPPDAVRSLSDNPPPQAPKRPYLVNGSFSPVTSTPLLPTFTSAQDLNAPMRKVTPERFASPLGTPEPLMSPGLPSAIADRKSKNLDVLFGNTGADTDGSEERDPLFDDGEEEDEAAQLEAQRMEAIQVALNEIMSEDMRSTVDLSALREREHTPLSPTMDSGSLYGSFDVDPLTMSVELVWPERHPLAGNKLTSRSAEDISSMRDEESPSPPTPARRAAQLDERIAARKKRLARRGSLEPARPTHQSTKSIFADDQEDEEATAESAADGEDTQVDDVQLAAPGMELSVEIARLDGKIAELDQQASLLNSLISQAELTGNQKELKLLTRSQSSLMREQRAAQFQKTQYEQQREENRLVPGRTQVSIPSTLISRGDHEGGRQIVRYNVEIKQTGEDGRVLTSWIVTHRYNEFYQLDRRLHDWATASTNPQLAEDMRKTVDLPGKRLVPNMSANFVETRRAALEKYLQVSL
jgi:sorting nexin-25